MNHKKRVDSFKILLTVDGSPHSKAAIRFIRNAVLPPRTSLYLLRVIDSPEKLRRGSDTAAIKAIEKQDIDKAWEDLRRQSEHLQTSDRSVTPLVSVGTPGGEILKAIDKRRINLVVMGTHGRRGVNRFLLGSVSEWVLAEAPCSTLIVRPQTRAMKSKTKGLRILLATDGSPDAEAAVALLRRIDFSPSSRLTILHTVKKHFYQTEQLLTTTQLSPAELTQAAEGLLQERGRKGAELLHDTSSKFSDKACTVTEHLAYGASADEILKCAKRVRAELIVLGSRGLTGMRKLLIGSVSNKVARHAACSVLVVRRSQ
ncbi:MAG: universal stress protein [Nitrospirales bacterium]|nr:universal stress protein [Nitrospira sp.]MDR4502534.1 universal stress protein [Nitrospirales bacterium]